MTKIIPAATANSLMASKPAFLSEQVGAPAGLDILTQYITPPRIKVVQKSAMAPLNEMFSTGDIVAMPMMQLVAGIKKLDNGKSDRTGEPFFFTPILFYPEWLSWNPLEMKGVLPVIRDRSFDPTSDLAVKSRSPETWSSPCPEMPSKDGKPLFVRHCEHLNFVIVIEPPNPLAGIPIVISYARGEHKVGSNFCAQLKMRGTDIYGCRFEGKSTYRPGSGKGDWYGVDVQNPADGGWVQDEGLFKQFKQLHEEYLESYRKKLIIVDHSDEVDGQVESTTVDPETSKY